MATLSLNAMLRDSLRFLHATVPENIVLKQKVTDKRLFIRGDGTQLHQVLLNLISNACDALEQTPSPQITIHLDQCDGNNILAIRSGENRNRIYACLSISDNGCGIPSHIRQHIFDPFFTTKKVGKGTGLGLAMVYGTVEAHGGLIRVESREGQGTTFHIYLPLLEEKKVDDDTQQESVQPGNGETILLVDDQTHVLETGRELLENLGYRVLMADNRKQAVEMFSTHRNEIDLILLDLVMPEMNGDQAARKIRAIHPAAKIIHMTGYDKHIRGDLSRETILAKPFSVTHMSRLIRRTLDPDDHEIRTGE